MASEKTLMNTAIFNRIEQFECIELCPNEIAGTVSREAKLSLGLVE